MARTAAHGSVLARFLGLRDPDGHRGELFHSHYPTIDIEDEIGGWIASPDRWWNDHTDFAEVAKGATPFAEPGR